MTEFKHKTYGVEGVIDLSCSQYSISAIKEILEQAKVCDEANKRILEQTMEEIIND